MPRRPIDLDRLSESALVIASAQLKHLRRLQRTEGLDAEGTRQLVSLLREIVNLEKVRSDLARDSAKGLSDAQLQAELRKALNMDVDIDAAAGVAKEEPS